MHMVGAYEAKTNLSRLLDDVAQGETIVVTKHGKPIAKIVPYEEDVEEKRRKRAAVIEAFREYWKTAPRLEGVTTKDLINEGQRF